MLTWVLMLHLAVSCAQLLFARAEGSPSGRIGASGGQVEQVGGVSGGIMTIETRQPGEPLFGRQMTNGQDLLKVIYTSNGRRLAACERFQGQTPELRLFLDQFSNLTSVLQRGQRGGGAKVKDDDDDDFNWPPIDWQRSWKDCAGLHREAQQQRSSSRVRPPIRSRRGVSSMILPGTAWCGVGNRSEEASNARSDDGETDVVSVHVETDRCCRSHDRCPFTIEGFTRKYNYYNFRFHTISFCECDASFRRCLMMAGDENSQMVGRLFFNVIGMKCFTIEPEVVCAERAWWGKCIRTRVEPTAYIRDPTPYNSISS